MLTYLDVHGKTVTADAMHCQRRTSEEIVARKGNYVFGLKENQPSLLADVRMYFEDTDLTRRISDEGEVIFFPYLTVIHGWRRDNHTLKGLKPMIISMVKYFNKWGWKWI